MRVLRHWHLVEVHRRRSPLVTGRLVGHFNYSTTGLAAQETQGRLEGVELSLSVSQPPAPHTSSQYYITPY